MNRDELAKGVIGKIQLTANGQVERINGAKLQFDQDNGALLEFTTATYQRGNIDDLRGEFSACTFFFDEVTVRSTQIISEGGSHIRCNALRMLSAYGIEHPELHPCHTTSLIIEHFDRYVHTAAIRTIGGGPDRSVVEFLRMEGAQVRLDAWQATWCIHVDAHPSTSSDGILTAKPECGVIIRYDVPASPIERLSHAQSLWIFFEILMHRTNKPPWVHFRDEQTGYHVNLSDTMGSRSIDHMEYGLYQVPFPFLSEDLGHVFERWEGSFRNSQALDNLVRLIRYPNLPIDLRFFMAYSALSGLNVQVHGLNQYAAEKMRIAPSPEPWRKLLSALDAGKMTNYLLRMVDTRNAIAHSHPSDRPTITDPHDLKRATGHLIAMTKAQMLAHCGLTSEQIDRFLTHMRDRIDRGFGLPTFES